jgi:hypothetical protein
MGGETSAGTACIRQITPRDIDALVDIYVECFPERVQEVFGGPHRRTFIRDYLLFYLSLDPAGNWAYVRDGVVVGFTIVPCHYSPWRAVVSRGQLFRWVGHFLSGQYGFPVHILKSFLTGGFAFTAEPAIQRLRGRPYIHLIAVKPGDRKGSAGGLLGVGRQLLSWTIAEHRRRGIHFCWAVVQPSAGRFIPIWKRVGFKLYPLSNGEHLALLGDPGEDLGGRECLSFRDQPD